MMYLPRLCEHCLNPTCVASCPSGSIYKREEDGIVLIDQDKCRGWRMCVSGCPYKKIYYNWKSNKAEKCIFCYNPERAKLGDLSVIDRLVRSVAESQIPHVYLIGGGIFLMARRVISWITASTYRAIGTGSRHAAHAQADQPTSPQASSAATV